MMIPFLLKVQNNNVIADYYVDSNLGNDLNAGTVESPLKTITTAISKNGMIVALKSGSIFNENILLQGIGGLKLIKYGGGNNPKITGKYDILNTNWVNEGNNIWSYHNTEMPEEITNVFKNNLPLTLGRYPKEDYILNGTCTISSIAPNINYADGYWTGSELFIKKNGYAAATVRVTNYINNVISFPNLDMIPYSGCGFFFENHINCLSVQDEWAYNNTTKTLYIYSIDNPSNISYANKINNIKIFNSSVIEFNSIDFEKSSLDAIDILFSDYITIKKCKFKYIGSNAIRYRTVTNLTIDNCTSINTNNNFVDGCWFSARTPSVVMAQKSSHVTVTNNNISKCGLTPGRLVNFNNLTGDSFHGVGISTALTDNAVISDNIIDNVSYCGIMWETTGNALIERNKITNFMLNFRDGAAIYTWSNNATYNASFGMTTHGGIVKDNLIYQGLNGVDCFKGDGYTNTFASPTSNFAFGIYNDNNSHDIIVDNNTILDVDFGIFNNQGKDGGVTTRIDTINNTIFINGKQGDNYNYYGILNASNDYTISGNIIAMLLNDAENLIAMSSITSTSYAINNNKYLSPFNSIKFNFDGVNKSFSQWSVISNITYELLNSNLFSNSVKPKVDYVKIILNSTKNSIIINNTSLPYQDYVDIDGIDFGTSRTILPYKSLILVRKEN